MTTGFTIGKFAPLHKGHEYLIRTAINEMDDFYVIVYDDQFSEIDIETKINWIKKKFPTVKILKAYNSPKQYGLDEISVNIQMEYLKKIICDIKFTHFYSSEEYGKYVAKYLNIENVLVDKERIKYNISATKIRKNLDMHKEFLDNEVYKEYKNTFDQSN